MDIPAEQDHCWHHQKKGRFSPTCCLLSPSMWMTGTRIGNRNLKSSVKQPTCVFSGSFSEMVPLMLKHGMWAQSLPQCLNRLSGRVESVNWTGISWITFLPGNIHWSWMRFSVGLVAPDHSSPPGVLMPIITCSLKPLEAGLKRSGPCL